MSGVARAQEPTVKKLVPSLLEFTVTTGPTLPNNISGMSEIVPSTFFNINTSWTYFPIEFGYLSGRSEGVSFSRYFVSVRNEFELFDMNYFWAIGINSLEYENEETAPFNTFGKIKNGGWHYGFGIKYIINRHLYLRPEINLAIRPSRILYVGLGFGFSIPESKSE